MPNACILSTRRGRQAHARHKALQLFVGKCALLGIETAVHDLNALHADAIRDFDTILLLVDEQDRSIPTDWLDRLSLDAGQTVILLPCRPDTLSAILEESALPILAALFEQPPAPDQPAAHDSALPELLRRKHITVAAAAGGPGLAGELQTRLPGIFAHIIDAAPPEVREKALGVPRPCMLAQNGVNREAAIHMAHSMIDLFRVDVGLSVLYQPNSPQCVLAIASKTHAAGFCFSFDGCDGAGERLPLLCRNIERFCLRTLEPFPGGLNDSIPIESVLKAPRHT